MTKKPDLGWALMRIFGSLAYLAFFLLLLCGFICCGISAYFEDSAYRRDAQQRIESGR